MNIPVLEIALLSVLLMTSWLAFYISNLRKRVAFLQTLVAERSEQSANVKAASIPADVLHISRPMITIEIDNPLEVAAKEVRGADVASAVVPVVVKKRVYQEVRQELAEELAGRGIAARVNVTLGNLEKGHL